MRYVHVCLIIIMFALDRCMYFQGTDVYVYYTRVLYVKYTFSCVYTTFELVLTYVLVSVYVRRIYECMRVRTLHVDVHVYNYKYRSFEVLSACSAGPRGPVPTASSVRFIL